MQGATDVRITGHGRHSRARRERALATTAIRDWAVDQGIWVAGRGPLPARVVALYQDAQPAEVEET